MGGKEWTPPGRSPRCPGFHRSRVAYPKTGSPLSHRPRQGRHSITREKTANHNIKQKQVHTKSLEHVTYIYIWDITFQVHLLTRGPLQNATESWVNKFSHTLC